MLNSTMEAVDVFTPSCHRNTDVCLISNRLIIVSKMPEEITQ